jgi:two-component system, LytTR family, response regulator
MMRILVVDDEAPARAKLRRMLAAESDAEVIGEATNGEEAVAAIRETKPDLVLLDVQMPGRDGFSVVAALDPADMPRIVFITAHSEHAIRAFEVRAIDYLLKPVPPGRFREMLQRVREDIGRGEGGDGISRQLLLLARSMSGRSSYLDRVLVKASNKSLFVPTSRIDWIEANRNNVTFHVGKEAFAERTSIGSIADRLDPALFLRINRSQIVRLDAIRELHPWSHGDYRIVLNDGTVLSWSRRYRAAGKQVFTP